MPSPPASALALSVVAAGFAAAGVEGLLRQARVADLTGFLSGALVVAGLAALAALVARGRLRERKRMAATGAAMAGGAFLLLALYLAPAGERLDAAVGVGGIGGLVLALTWPLRATRLLAVGGVLVLVLAPVALVLTGRGAADAPLALQASLGLLSSGLLAAGMLVAARAEAAA